jgi:hypothetical protein
MANRMGTIFHVGMRGRSWRRPLCMALLPLAFVLASPSVGVVDSSASPIAAPASATTFDGPTAVVANKADVWAANIIGDSVTEFSATSGGLIRSIKGKAFKFQSPDAIALSGDDVWVANLGPDNAGGQGPGSVTEFATSTGKLVRVVAGAAFDFTEPVALATNGVDVWVADQDNTGASSITEFAAATGKLVRVINAAAYDFEQLQDVIVNKSDVWVSSYDTNSVTEINAATGSLVRVLSGSTSKFDGPHGMAAQGHDLWITSTYVGTGSVTEVDTSTGAWVNTYSSSSPATGYEFGGPTAIAIKKPDAWVFSPQGGSGEHGALTGLKLSDGSAVAATSGTQYNFNEVPTTAGVVATNGKYVWITEKLDNTVAEFSATTGAFLQMIGS